MHTNWPTQEEQSKCGRSESGIREDINSTEEQKTSKRDQILGHSLFPLYAVYIMGSCALVCSL